MSGFYAPLLPSLDAESSAIGRDAEVNEVIKGVIIVFKIIFNVGRLSCCRGLRSGGGGRFSGLHVCVIAVCCPMFSIGMNQFLKHLA